MPDNIVHLLDESRGCYIPNYFYKNFDFEGWGLKEEDYSELADVEHPEYWNTWEYLKTQASRELEGKKYSLYQDGSLYAIAYDHLTEKESVSFFGSN